MDVVAKFILAIYLAAGSGDKPPLPGSNPPVYVTNTDPSVDKDHPAKP